MKSIGLIIASISVLCLLLALNMSTTVTTERRTFGDFTVPSMTVNNLGLMQDKQNYIIVSSVFLILGVGIYVLTPKNDSEKSMLNDESEHKPSKEKNGQAVKNIKINSSERNIDNDSYKLYLVEKYKISRNEILNKFVLVNKLYQNLDEVLIAAHEKDKIESESDDKRKDSFQITSDDPNASRWLTMTVFSIARERDESERAVRALLIRRGIRCKDFDGQQKTHT